MSESDSKVPPPKYRRVELETDAVVAHWVCSRCGSLVGVDHVTRHDQFHINLAGLFETLRQR